MYFDFEDHRPETPILERPLTRLEQILLTVIAYLLIVIGLIIYPRLPFVKAFEAARLEKLAEERKLQEERREPMQYVFAMPKVQRERIPPKPKYLSDESHTAQTNQRVQIPKNDVPASRGDSPEKRIADSSQPQPDTSKEATAP